MKQHLLGIKLSLLREASHCGSDGGAEIATVVASSDFSAANVTDQPEVMGRAALEQNESAQSMSYDRNDKNKKSKSGGRQEKGSIGMRLFCSRSESRYIRFFRNQQYCIFLL